MSGHFAELRLDAAGGNMDRDILKELAGFLETGITKMQSALSQAWLWISELFFLPGYLILDWLIVRLPGLADPAGLNSEDGGKLFAAVFASVSWLMTVVLIKAVYNVIRNVLVSIASIYRRLTDALGYELRVIRRKLLAPVREIGLRLQIRKYRLFEEFQIDELQLAILRVQSMRPPAHAITAIEAGEGLGVRPLRAQQALSGLNKLHLMEVSFATSEGCPGYFLTRPGEVYVAWCDRRSIPSC